ncbi:zinc finger CCCH-type antiviral protein 1-like isoform X3 [Ranitomeya variabilis]|uniref:zinc finger CCCH-type antiviral protein 1-like isoform X3 n=1 Tax=Ranitomeya variabilis TaxID=490064 RepID=UPI0040563ACA
MSDPTVTAFLTKLLCSQGGRIPRDQLSGFLKLPPEQIEQILQDEPQRFSLVGDIVLARNPVRICPKYLKDETEEECDKLHLCRYYLQDKCKSFQCKFSHDILSSHNQSILKAQGVSGLNEDELKVLLYQNDNQMLPEICVKYLHDTCDLGQACSRLHVCGFFTRGECNRRQCIRSHHLLESSADLLLARSRMSQVSVENFQMLCAVKHNERFQSLSESGKKSEEKGNPAARRGRGKGRGRHRNNKKGDSQNETRSKSRGRQGDRAGSNFRGRSSSRAMSENGEQYLSWSGDEEEEAASAKSQADKIMEDWFSPTPARSDDRGASLLHTGVRASPIIPPLMSIGIHHPTSTVTTISPASPHVSSQPGVPAGLLTQASTPSVPQLKPAITPMTTTRPFNTPGKPVNLPKKGPSVVDYNNPVPPSTVKPPSVTPVPPSRPNRIVDSSMESPSFTNPLITHDLTTIRPVTTSESNATAPTSSQLKLVNPPTIYPPVPLKKPVITSSPLIPQPVSTIKSVTPPVVSPYLVPSAPPPSYPKLENATTEGPPVLHVKPVLSRPWYQPALDDKPISGASVREDLLTTKPTYSDLQTSPKRVESDKVPEICIPNLWKYCRLGGRCPEMHYYLPYRWQINKGTDWEDVPNMEQVEKCYCDPMVDRVPLIDFLTMRSGGHHVRRLSTVSSVMKPSEYVLTTEWLWYWRDEYGSWIQYGQSNLKQVSSNILSSDLENVYLPDPVAVIPFNAGNQKYEINFRVMKQKNIQYKTEKDVRRRPKFLSFEDVKLLRGSTRSAAAKSPLRSGTSPMNTDIFPKIWDPEAMPEIGCKKVLVSHTSSEFSEIVTSFSKTVSGHEVKRMWRLQNPTLWQVFQWQKEQMKKLNQGRDVKEIRSFHGTERTHIETICSQNFDWRICGTHGTVYGQGSYFARDASYSHNYSTPTSSGTRAMFIARVLVGDYVTGNPQMKRPPLRPGSISQCYDSCVDNIISPSIFVVFEKHQIYPEYLLEYEEEQKKSCIVC